MGRIRRECGAYVLEKKMRYVSGVWVEGGGTAACSMKKDGTKKRDQFGTGTLFWCMNARIGSMRLTFKCVAFFYFFFAFRVSRPGDNSLWRGPCGIVRKGASILCPSHGSVN